MEIDGIIKKEMYRTHLSNEPGTKVLKPPAGAISARIYSHILDHRSYGDPILLE
ncbi:MAG: hypothetical protein ACRD47_06045 [Nitrososphaeraceae archaeon]